MSDNILLTLNAVLRDTKEARAKQVKDDEYFEFFAAEQTLMHYQLAVGDIEDGIVGQTSKPENERSDGG